MKYKMFFSIKKFKHYFIVLKFQVKCFFWLVLYEGISLYFSKQWDWTRVPKMISPLYWFYDFL